MRATNFGDLVFVDHVDIGIDKYKYCVLVAVDASSNLLWAQSQKNKEHDETIFWIRKCAKEWNVRFKALCADAYFHEPRFKAYYNYNGIKAIALGPNTPWPNRAEAAVKTFKKHAQILIDNIRRYETTDPSFENVTVNMMLEAAVEARNRSITYGGKTPLEIAFGRPPPPVARSGALAGVARWLPDTEVVDA